VSDAVTRSVLLIHGGLWEDGGADWFWRQTGVIDGLERRGLSVVAPDRIRRAPDWTTEARHLAAAVADHGLAGQGLTVLAGSFGCAAAVRLALDFPGLSGRLILAWPASVADAFTMVRVRAGLSRQGAGGKTLGALLGTGALPSARDDELRGLGLPAAIIPSVPPNALHPRSAVDALLRELPAAVELPGCPEAPRPEFASRREAFLDSVTAFAGSKQA
jgi:pimeloyl-ACP methyl ester carboxylesterase